MHRSLEMVLALYGVLKAGGAYLPLDPDYPADRLASILEDSGLQIVLTQSHLEDAPGRLGRRSGSRWTRTGKQWLTTNRRRIRRG